MSPSQVGVVLSGSSATLHLHLVKGKKPKLLKQIVASAQAYVAQPWNSPSLLLPDLNASSKSDVETGPTSKKKHLGVQDLGGTPIFQLETLCLHPIGSRTLRHLIFAALLGRSFFLGFNMGFGTVLSEAKRSKANHLGTPKRPQKKSSNSLRACLQVVAKKKPGFTQLVERFFVPPSHCLRFGLQDFPFHFFLGHSQALGRHIAMFFGLRQPLHGLINWEKNWPRGLFEGLPKLSILFTGFGRSKKLAHYYRAHVFFKIQEPPVFDWKKRRIFGHLFRHLRSFAQAGLAGGLCCRQLCCQGLLSALGRSWAQLSCGLFEKCTRDVCPKQSAV